MVTPTRLTRPAFLLKASTACAMPSFMPCNTEDCRLLKPCFEASTSHPDIRPSACRDHAHNTTSLRACKVTVPALAPSQLWDRLSGRGRSAVEPMQHAAHKQAFSKTSRSNTKLSDTDCQEGASRCPGRPRKPLAKRMTTRWVAKDGESAASCCRWPLGPSVPDCGLTTIT